MKRKQHPTVSTAASMEVLETRQFKSVTLVPHDGAQAVRVVGNNSEDHLNVSYDLGGVGAADDKIKIDTWNNTGTTAKTYNLWTTDSNGNTKANINAIIFEGCGGRDWLNNATLLTFVAHSDTAHADDGRVIFNSKTGLASAEGFQDRHNRFVVDDDGVPNNPIVSYYLNTYGQELTVRMPKFKAGSTDPMVKKIRYDGGERNDEVRNQMYVPMEAYGYDGYDTLVGQGKYDSLYGGNHDDKIASGNTRAWMFGGRGNDSIFGGSGHDVIYGEDGDDYIEGGNGTDNVQGANGRDKIFGQGDADSLHGGKDNDTVSGGAGSDSVFGNEGNDWVSGGDGNDGVYGNDGNDQVQGDSGDDFVRGGNGFDTCWGGAGNDRMSENGVDGQKDVYFGNSGKDRFEYIGLFDGKDVIADYDLGQDSYVNY